ncbi:uncharacterized protein EI90DRAFT_3133621 [Cantharellus anzutake]|uniref:uncharacterized protein n=1 Tax=Cantharellus anzutake TaxID=1750568 RepID=UPI0019037435|nr:uncharacterized protein EI90DRAFT_3133621 [Cantharellus anzutake]KAF8317836.1 hypothetical protein EI90DRAFT_3133621 [Cantharellus anzutake]
MDMVIGDSISVTNNLRNENKELQENFHGLKIENVHLDLKLRNYSCHQSWLRDKCNDLEKQIDHMEKEANTYKGSRPHKIPHMSRVGTPPIPSQHSQHRAPVVPMSVSNVEVHNHAARPPVPTRVRVPLAGLMDSHYGHHAAPIPPLGPQGPSSSFGAMTAPPPPQPSKVPNLVPEGYSWFAEANRSPAAGNWRNVPIPGTVFPGHNHHQKRWNDWVHPFLNLIEGFKFMVDLKWLDHEMRNGFNSASLEAHQLHGQFFDIKFVNRQNMSATELNGCFGDRPRNFENTNEAGKKYLLCCLLELGEGGQFRRGTGDLARRDLGLSDSCRALCHCCLSIWSLISEAASRKSLGGISGRF